MKERNRDKAVRPQVLSGWKEIAVYLGKGVRTVQRYERELGLPVRRPAGRPRAAVVATKQELDAWVTASPIREAFRLSSTFAPSRYLASAQEIRSGLGQMLKLRDDMRDLQTDLRRSTEVLRETVLRLYGELYDDRWRSQSAAFNVLERGSRKEQVSSLARTLSLQRKAF